MYDKVHIYVNKRKVARLACLSVLKTVMTDKTVVWVRSPHLPQIESKSGRCRDMVANHWAGNTVGFDYPTLFRT